MRKRLIRNLQRKITKTNLVIAFLLVLTFLATFALSASWTSVATWQSNHYLETNRDDSATVILLVALDDRLDGTGAMPDTLVLYDTDNGTFQSISREWTFSRLNPANQLVEEHLGIQDCRLFCGIQGVFASSYLANGGQVSREFGLELLRKTVELEYGIQDLGIVAIDLEWSKSFLTCLAPLEIEVMDRIPIGGTPINGTLMNIRSYVEIGKQELGGNELFWFARAREGSSNEERIKRQEVLFGSILSQVPRPTLLGCVLDAKGYVSTDLNLMDFSWLVPKLIS